jgi:pyruvate dehydrogenase E2 component (dihydrolipoamide acetyltransferase)
MADDVTPIVMPKWGLSMKEGTIVEVLVAAGEQIAVGQELMEVETDKIDGTVEAVDAGMLRRLVAEVGKTYPVKGLLGVLADPSVPDEVIDSFVSAYEVHAEDDEAGADESPYLFTDVDGMRIRYARLGSGERTVVLVHGFGGDIDNWLFTIGPLAEQAEVLAIDLPGHGQSELRLPGTSVESLATFLVRVLDVLGVGEAHLVGHSLGGAIVAQAALDYPDRVASVALISSAGLGRDINAEYLAGMVAAQSKREVKPVLATLFADEARVTRSMVDGVLRYKRLDGVRELLAELSMGAFPDGRQASDPARRLDTARMPLLVVWGDADRVIPASHAHLAPAGAAVVVIEGAGHMVQMEKASEVNALLQRHLCP